MDQKRIDLDMELLRTQGKNPKLDKPKDWYDVDWDNIQKETDVLDQVNPKKIKVKLGGD